MKILHTTLLLAVLIPVQEARSQETASRDSLQQTLQEAVVSADSPAIRLEGSTLVATIAGSPLQQLGNALDVLSQLPLISVTDDAITVTGKGSPEIYIDGRPLRDTEKLRRLQAADIRKVETVLAPGAVYDSTTRAVLKITTRRDTSQGLSLTARGSADRRREWSAVGALDLDYRTGAWNFFAEGTAAHQRSRIKGSTHNALLYGGRLVTTGSSQNNTMTTRTGTVKAGFNHVAGRQSFGAYYQYHPEHGDFDNRGTEWEDGLAATRRDIARDISAGSHLAAGYYDNTFGNRWHVHFDGTFRQSTSDNSTGTAYPAGDFAAVLSTDLNRSRLLAGKLYLTCALAGGELTAGGQASRTQTSLDYRMLNPETEIYLPSGITETRQTAAAAFAAWQRTFGRFSLSAGLRYEYTDYRLRTDRPEGDNRHRADHRLTPDVSLGYSPDNRTQFTLSYKASTIRPPYAQLTGSLNYTGRHEIEGGNPALRDEHMHDVQFTSRWRDFILQADFVHSADSYAFVKQVWPAPTLQLLMHPVNIDVDALSAYLVWRRKIGRWLPDVTLGCYRQWLTLDGTRHERPIFSYNVGSVVTLPHDFTLSLNSWGCTQGDMHTNRFGATRFALDVGAGKHFFGKSLMIKLSVTDVFNTQSNGWTMNTCGVQTDKRQRYDRRGVKLSLTYRFRPRQSTYKGATADEAELNRL